MNLIKISLAASFLGILLLLFLANLEPKLTRIAELNQTKLETRVKIKGKILSIKEINPNFFILTLKDKTGSIQVLLDKNFSSNKTLEIIGRLEKYKDKLQIEAEKIQVREK